ncbi:hypothetical protein P3X46_016941 [Hevea brasiliensis]|uniref:J domain-containing protein n=1 Tax=Hevea brasiliensis TaxID=3981 RepID=A0ABQ9M0W8_HEVBR|nr:chaperone protein dnaJ 11, chloroplastic [Hevea brasiliensis]KAJ9173846.1 hypothetical protein P3X46_016941 [Hevea brasiliensis]
MFATTYTLTLNPPFPAAGKPLVASPTALPYTPSAVGSHRRMNMKASVSTFVESIPVESGKTLSLYDILRVKQTASQMEIKTAYRSLAKLYHPDAIHEEAQSDGRDFIDIHNAYETLSDPAARAIYDLSLESASNYYGRRRGFGFSDGYCPTRRWETDQCW